VDPVAEVEMGNAACCDGTSSAQEITVAETESIKKNSFIAQDISSSKPLEFDTIEVKGGALPQCAAMVKEPPASIQEPEMTEPLGIQEPEPVMIEPIGIQEPVTTEPKEEVKEEPKKEEVITVTGAKKWTVTIDKIEDKKVGMALMPLLKSESLHILRVKKINPGGLIDTFNAANPDDFVEAGDRLLSANGQKTDLGECLKNTTGEIKLEFERPPTKTWTIELSKKGPLGVSLGENLLPKGIYIINVNDTGMITDFNKCNALQAVRPQDIISEVNGVKDINKLLETIQGTKDGESMSLTINRKGMP